MFDWSLYSSKKKFKKEIPFPKFFFFKPKFVSMMVKVFGMACVPSKRERHDSNSERRIEQHCIYKALIEEGQFRECLFTVARHKSAEKRVDKRGQHSSSVSIHNHHTTVPVTSVFAWSTSSQSRIESFDCRPNFWLHLLLAIQRNTWFKRILNNVFLEEEEEVVVEKLGRSREFWKN